MQIETTWTKGDQGPFGIHPHAFGMFNFVYINEGSTFIARATVNPVSEGRYKKEATTLEEGESDLGVIEALRDLQMKVSVRGQRVRRSND